MKQTKILYVASECSGFMATGGLAEVAGSLPKAIMATSKSYKVKVVLPLYKAISEKYRADLKFLGSSTVSLAWRELYVGVFSLKKDGVEYYFIDNKYYFDREKAYGYYDDGERFAYFSKSIFALMEITGFYPNIIHCNDWHTALTNVYLDVLYKKEGKLTDIKSVFTIHNIEYQGVYDITFLYDVVGIDSQYQGILEYNGLVNYVKGAIVCSDIVTTVSPRYSREISTTSYSCGLEYIVRLNNNKICGIINGIDVDFYNPETDTSIYKTYSLETLEDKKVNKVELQKEYGLEVDPDVCLVSVISRLASHKGIDLILEKFESMMCENVQFVVVGTGAEHYENSFNYFANKYPGKVKSLNVFNTKLAKKVYAASDIFLMPSKMEPCGLSQMIASRYGAVPFVRETGGLYDTIKAENGYTFKEYNSDDMLYVFKNAVSDYYNVDSNLFKEKLVNSMNKDFSWNASAKEYISMYKKMLKNK